MPSPITQVRTPPLLRATLERAAAADGVTLSALIRRGALERATRILIEHEQTRSNALRELAEQTTRENDE
jgi:uncharacterized protein (DUF1778 family)